MKTTRILIEIDENSKVRVKTEGFQGPACMKTVEKLIAGVEEVAGIKVDTKAIQKTAEYDQTETQTVVRRQVVNAR